jgi:hypothetical protein
MFANKKFMRLLNLKILCASALASEQVIYTATCIGVPVVALLHFGKLFSSVTVAFMLLKSRKNAR